MSKPFNELLNESRLFIKEYITKLFIPESIKSEILTEVNSENNAFYLFYPHLFKNAFEHLAHKKVQMLSIGGYFYYKYLLYLDDLLDNKSNVIKKENILFLHFYHEESIKIISELFYSNSNFWILWNKRENEYFNALSIDKAFVDSLTIEKFEEMADSKSAFAKVAIDSLYLLCKKKDKDSYNKLLLSHKYFSCGFQLLDDIYDFKIDIQNKQTNYAVIQLKEHLKNNDINFSSFDINTFNKYLYIENIGQELLIKAINYFNKATELSSNLGVDSWLKVIEVKRKEAEGILHSVSFFIDALHIKARLEHRKEERQYLFGISTNNKMWKNSIKEAIRKGINFLVNEQEENGTWLDSPVNAWLSTYWSTAWVLHHLSYLPYNLIKGISKEKALNFFEQNHELLWGYLADWIPDADSSNFVLLALKKNKSVISNEKLYEWLKYQNKDGGFTAYYNRNYLINSLGDPEIDDVAGWTSSHLCVSSVALLVLSQLNICEKERKKLIQYILKSQCSNFLWKSYWWTSPIYSTSFIIEANHYLNNKELGNAINKSIPSLFNLQNGDGTFKDPHALSHPFYTGMALGSLCLSNTVFTNYRSKIDEGFKALLTQQFLDGSWPSGYALRIPKANHNNPDLIDNWKKIDIGQNILIEDIHRVITTSTIVSALYKYATKAGIY